MSCSPHNNPANYRESKGKDGRTRMTCKVCKRFIGYREPEPAKTTGKK